LPPTSTEAVSLSLLSATIKGQQFTRFQINKQQSTIAASQPQNGRTQACRDALRCTHVAMVKKIWLLTRIIKAFKDNKGEGSECIRVMSSFPSLVLVVHRDKHNSHVIILIASRLSSLSFVAATMQSNLILVMMMMMIHRRRIDTLHCIMLARSTLDGIPVVSYRSKIKLRLF
jgi:hypothetical protein